MRRQALPARDPGGEDRPRPAHAQRGRRARTHRERSGAALRARPRGHPRAAAHRGRGPGVREARPARAHAVGWRGAAPQARGLPGRCGQVRQRQPPVGGAQGHAVPVRRAHHRPALRRHRQAHALAAQVAGRGPFAGGDRAQPRRDPRG